MSLEQTIDNLQIRNANMVTFVGTSNTMVDTTTGRIQTKGIQHNSNVITDVSGPHGRGVATLKKYPEIAFGKGKFDSNPTTNTFVQAGYTFIPSSSLNPTDWPGDEIFDGHLGPGSGWLSENSYAGTALGSAPTLPNATPAAPIGEYVTVKMPKKIKLSHMLIAPLAGSYTGNAPIAGKIYGGLDGTNWTEIGSFSGFTYSTNQYNKINGTSTAYYSHFALVGTAITDLTNPNWMGIGDWELYGYEEDPPAGDHSVDTTFKSRFNNPQTTGVQVLVDGATGVGTNQISGGPDPSGNQSTYVTDGKYWTLNGTLTSNLAVEANTFLEGDQPHAVSVWFNSSNLEANVSNTCVFSISDQEKLDSVNLDLQSNTWHNLTYAYQGGRGSRVTYLDGRKVAEDQAEDTFGDYPPFAMTGYSQGGYVVSASNEENTDRTAYTLFNDVESEGNGWRDTGGTFQAGTGGHYRSNGTYDPATGIPRANLGSDSGGTAFATADEGEWVKIELPYKIKLNYFTLQPRNSTNIANGSNPSLSWGRSEFIKNGKIWGSNDGINWSVVHTISGTSASSDTVINSYTVGSSVAYKYFAIVITATNTSTSYASSTSLSEWKLYGHRENDLVRLPDPTNVLKYPHVNFTGHGTAPTNGYHAVARRGYVVSASTQYGSANLTDAWRAFDGVVDLTSGSGGQSWDSAPNTYASSGTGRASTGTTTFNTRNGEWINVKFPNKVLLTSYQHWTRMDRDHEGPYSGYLYGSNDGFSTFQEIHRFSAITLPTISGGVKYLHTVSSSYTPDGGSAVALIPYNEYRLQVTHTQGSPYLNIALLEFYGTEEATPVPIQIGGGNIDKVANFRVYDRFIDEDQVNEIWNAQKEEFGRAKPQMVLQQGKLGIGTDAPQGSLSVADEPHNLEEFPPRAMTSYETYMEGHGVFKASASEEYSKTIAGNASGDEAWKNFDKGFTNWTGGASYTGTNNTYQGTHSTGGYGGDYIELKLPYKIKLQEFIIQPSPGLLNRWSKSGVIMAKNTIDNTWTKISSWSGSSVASVDAYKPVYFKGVDSTNAFDTFRLVITSVDSQPYVTLFQWRLFGTREQGQSVLHDGQLTLTKNLNVPRIGPPLDADDTPRRGRLVVEYNTSTNPTFEGAVRDTSGRGNDGAFYSGAYYDATEKALVFDGTDDTIRGTQNIGTGEKVLTMAMWFKRTVAVNTWDYVCTIGTSTTGQMAGFTINSNKFNFTKYGAQTLSTTTINNDQWYHVVGVYKGGNWDTTNTEIYVNGVKETITGGTSSALNLTGNQITFGDSTLYDGTSSFNGQISNFKLYDVALTADEVKTLYDMGRNGSVANPQPLHIAAHLYSPGTIVQVEQAVKTDTQTTTVASPVDVSGLSVTIRPKFSNSKILVSYQVNMGGDYHMFLRVLRTQNGVTTIVGSGDAAGTRPLASSYQSHMNVNDQRSMNMEILEPCNGTDAIEYKVQFWVAHVNYTASINRAMTAADNVYNAFVSSSITAKEVCQ